MIKMIRIARIHRIISKMKKAEDVKAVSDTILNFCRVTKLCGWCS